MELVNTTNIIWDEVLNHSTFEAIPVLYVKTAIFAALSILLWYYLFWKPFDLYRDFRKYGGQFEEVERCKRNVINKLQQKKKLGDLPPAYPNGWYVLLESDKLKRGEVKEVNLLGMNLVAWRGTSGRAYASDAYCPHLGAHLGVGGYVSKECITCPFHEWSFDGSDGKLVNIPYSPSSCSSNDKTNCNGSITDEKKSNSLTELVKLKMETVVEMNDFIFIWFHAEEEKPLWYPEVVPEILTGELVYRGRSEFRLSCHVQELPENGPDVNHLNAVHQTAMMAGDNPVKASFSWPGIKHVWSGQWKQFEEPEKKHMSNTVMYHHINVFNTFKCLHIRVTAQQYGPGIVLAEFVSFFGRGLLFVMITPLEPLLQKVTHRFYTTRGVIHPMAKLFMLGEVVQWSRDAIVWNRKTFLKNPVLPKEDSAIKRYRLWYQQFYSENSPRLYFAKSNTEGELY